jgi:hypothetical protein
MSEDVEVLLHSEGDPLILWLFDQKLGMNGFYGLDPKGRNCVGINLASKDFKDIFESYGVEATLFCLNIWMLHELTHWATRNRRGHRRWDCFLINLLLSLEDEPK